MLAGRAGIGAALRVTVTDVLCTEYPPFPSTVTVYVPGEPLHESVDVSEPPIERLLGETEQDKPLADVVVERLTVPVNPYSR